MKRANSYKYFTTFKGLPPDGEPGIFLGWDADHQPWTLVWQAEQGHWGALGWEKDNESVQPDRAVYKILRDDNRDLIVEWAFSPVCPPLKAWAEEGERAYAPDESWQSLADWREHFLDHLYKNSALPKGTLKRGNT